MYLLKKMISFLNFFWWKIEAGNKLFFKNILLPPFPEIFSGGDFGTALTTFRCRENFSYNIDYSKLDAFTQSGMSIEHRGTHFYIRVVNVADKSYAVQYRADNVGGIHDLSFDISFGAANSEQRSGVKVKKKSLFIECFSIFFRVLSKSDRKRGLLSGLILRLPGLSWRFPQYLLRKMLTMVEPFYFRLPDFDVVVFHPMGCRRHKNDIREYLFVNQEVTSFSNLIKVEVSGLGAPCIEGTFLLSLANHSDEVDFVGPLGEIFPGLNAGAISFLGFDGTWQLTRCDPLCQSEIFRNPSSHCLWSDYGFEYETLGAYRDQSLYALFGLLMVIGIETQNERGWWASDDISPVMARAFGERVGRLDDRRSTNLAWALYRWYLVVGYRQARDSALKYADAIIDLYDSVYFYKEPLGGILFPDYYHEDFTVWPHASLNHNLNLANFLIHVGWVEGGGDVGERRCQIGSEILRSITSNYNEWIMDSGDLVYAFHYPPELTEGPDYLLLTLNDLLLSKEIISRVNIKGLDALKNLISAKRGYLENIGVEFDANSQVPFVPNALIEKDKVVIFRKGVLTDFESSGTAEGDACG